MLSMTSKVHVLVRCILKQTPVTQMVFQLGLEILVLVSQLEPDGTFTLSLFGQGHNLGRLLSVTKPGVIKKV